MPDGRCGTCRWFEPGKPTSCSYLQAIQGECKYPVDYSRLPFWLHKDFGPWPISGEGCKVREEAGSQT